MRLFITFIFMRFLVLLLLLSFQGFSQEIPTLLGAHISFFNFPIRGSGLISGKSTTGAGLSLSKGLNRNLDWQVGLDFAFTDSLNGQKLNEKRMISETYISLIWLFAGRRTKIQPFLSAGAGLGHFSSRAAVVFPTGMGLRYRILVESYLILQGQYRITTGYAIPNHFLFGIGFYGQIRSKKLRSVNTRLPNVALPRSMVEPIDRDGDGILDSLDVCPDVAGLLQFQGCPDSDGDGIPNKVDSCPFLFGVYDNHGCPPLDRDKDGVSDLEDSCLLVAGPRDNHGCPLPDRDMDGVADKQDSCLLVAGSPKYQGCPLDLPALRLTLSRLSQEVQFDVGSDRLKYESFKSLDSIVSLLKTFVDLKVSIDGHTDNTYTSSFNLVLSKRRSTAVYSYFVNKGIDRHRLVIRAFGDRFPVASNLTNYGRSLNRRVEMLIVDR